MKKLIELTHWLSFAYFVYLFGYASLYKVFLKKSMVDGMASFGFNQTWTFFIGCGELIGVIGLLVGVFYHELKNIATIWLLFYAVGALMVHFAYQDYLDFYDALLGCIAAVFILGTDKYFKLIL